MFKPLKDLANLLVCNEKKIFLVGGCGFFVNDVIGEVVFWPCVTLA